MPSVEDDDSTEVAERRAAMAQLEQEVADTRQLIDVPHLPEFDAVFPDPNGGEQATIRVQTIMHARQYNKYADVFFQSGLDEDPRDFSPTHYHEHKMSVELWEQLGRPMTITVTIDPGDMLNAEVQGQAQEASPSGPVPEADQARDAEEEGTTDR